MKKYKNIFFILMTMFAILAQLVNPTLAYADGETPLPPTETAPTSLPVVTDVPTQLDGLATEATPTELPAATEVPASVSQTVDPVATDTPFADIATPEEPTLLEIMEQIPAQTDIVVLDTTGEAMPLATQEAADVVIEGDPVWCPGTQAPTPDTNGCSASYSSLSSLVAGFVPTSNGTIWIQSGADTGGNVTINGTGNWSSAATYSLTLQGGWSGMSGDTAIGTNSVFSVPISIINWTGSVAVNDITVNGALETGLTVINAGDIHLHNVTANGNGGNYDCRSDGNWSDCYSGVFLKNYYGVGNVILTGTNEFSNNQGWGLYIDSYGAISLENINATYNGLEGANLYGFQKDITLTGKNAFNSNGKYGEWSGLFIGTFGDVIISGSNEFNNNYYDGVEIWSMGNISINSIIAKNNAYSGAYFSTPQNVTVHSSVFSDNVKYGVDAYDVCGSLNFDSSTLTAFNSNVSGDYLNPAGGDYTFYYYDANTDKYEETTIPCKGEVTVDGKPINPNTTLNSVLEARSGNEVEFDLSCERRSSFPVTLTNGDKIEIICPVSGTARIKRLDNTMLPAELPAGYTYTSAFSLEIIKNNQPIDYIDEGGSVKVSFEVPYMEEGVAYSILYLDNGIWVPLKEFMLDGNGNPRGFNLHANDLRRILSGSNFIFEEGSPTRLEISTNFPGIFVLVQH